MKIKGKAWHLVVTVLLILAFVYTAFFGVSAKYGDVTTTYIKGAKDIRFGVDIKGGVNVTFVPSEDYDATEEQLEAAQLVIERDSRGDGDAYDVLVGRGYHPISRCNLRQKIELAALEHGTEDSKHLGAGVRDDLKLVKIAEHMALGLSGLQEGACIGLENPVLHAAVRHSGYLLP